MCLLPRPTKLMPLRNWSPTKVWWQPRPRNWRPPRRPNIVKIWLGKQNFTKRSRMLLTNSLRTPESLHAVVCSLRMVRPFASLLRVTIIRSRIYQHRDLPRLCPCQPTHSEFAKTCTLVWSRNPWSLIILTLIEADFPSPQSWCHTRTLLRSLLVTEAVITEDSLLPQTKITTRNPRLRSPLTRASFQNWLKREDIMLPNE